MTATMSPPLTDAAITCSATCPQASTMSPWQPLTRRLAWAYSDRPAKAVSRWLPGRTERMLISVSTTAATPLLALLGTTSTRTVPNKSCAHRPRWAQITKSACPMCWCNYSTPAPRPNYWQPRLPTKTAHTASLACRMALTPCAWQTRKLAWRIRTTSRLAARLQPLPLL